MYNPFSLTGKKILITGASSGIGRSIAIECSKMGAHLVITGRNINNLQKTISVLNEGAHEAISCDISQSEDISELVKQLPNLDGIVHNAGINQKMPVKFITDEKINAVFNTNFYAPVIITQKLLKQRKINKGGAMVFISSIASEYAAVSNAIYSSSKGALNSFLRVLALELAPRKIRANGIQPGIIRTKILESYQLQEDLAKHEEQYPLSGFGEPEDIAYAAVYLLSDASKWITGSILKIDGGVTLR